ncbi:carbohydrate kinase [Streptomyces sp. N2-109]|uniref:Carbohydrate kinase n=1 Tax=Streptomyces gossypii TaxID=2883101 RepID=A0ABT2JSP0_9ACTN|nr:carbohydrate kinase [Streptomyces gossypii]MCT2590907.1 carbohydrate kinase [Streptomyces gossypii]
MLGECVADAFVTTPVEDAATRMATSAMGLEVRPGGGPANTAVALARLGTPTRFLGRLSTDVFGRLFRAHLTGSGADLDGAVAAREPSTLAVAALDPDGRADYSFHADGAADWQWTPEELAQATDPPLSALHTGSLALVRPPGAAHLEELLHAIRARATVSIDPNVRPLLVDPARYRERLEHWCRAADILRLSDDDLAELCPGQAPERAADTFHAHGTRLVVVTLGPGGVFASLDGERVHVPAPPVEVVDTVGAGDSFMAGLLHALHGDGVLGGRLDTLRIEQVSEALTLGTRIAAAVCAVRGANPPWAAEL